MPTTRWPRDVIAAMLADENKRSLISSFCLFTRNRTLIIVICVPRDWFSLKTKVRIFKRNVLSVLLCGAQSWKVTSQMLEVLQNKCLRRILGIYLPNKISNFELRRKTCVRPVSLEVKQRKWRWIAHICRMPLIAIPRAAMRWTLDGKRKQGRPKETWIRSVEREMKDKGWS